MINSKKTNSKEVKKIRREINMRMINKRIFEKRKRLELIKLVYEKRDKGKVPELVFR